MEQRIIEQAVAGLERWRVFYHRERELECDEGVVTLAVVYCDEAGEQRQAFMDAVKAGIRASESPFSQEPLIVNYGKGGIALCWNILHSSGMSCPLSSTSIPDYISDVRSIGRAASRALSGRARRAGGGDMFQVPLPDESPSPSVNGIEVKGDLSAYIWPDSLESLAAAMKGASESLPYEEDIFLADSDDGEGGEVLLNCGGEPFIRRHDLALVYAPRKGGKSSLSMALAAACLGAPVLRFKRPESTPSLRVLIADCEQQAIDLKNELDLLSTLSGKDWRQLDIVTLKLVSRTPKERRERIEAALKHEEPDVLIIDVASKLLLNFNINDEKDSAELADIIKRWAANGPAIIATIHNNGGSGAADRPRGHLGTELENSAEHLIRLSARQDGTRTLTFTERRKPLEPFSYIRDDGGLHLIDDKGKAKRFSWADYLEPEREYHRAELVNFLLMWNPDTNDNAIKQRLYDDTKAGKLHKINNDAYVLP